eukprot:2231611-Alexandrium_andersonii.AAC.1
MAVTGGRGCLASCKNIRPACDVQPGRVHLGITDADRPAWKWHERPLQPDADRWACEAPTKLQAK